MTDRDGDASGGAGAISDAFGGDDASPSENAAEFERIWEENERIVEEITAPDEENACPRCELALSASGPPMCPRCGAPR